MRDLKSCLVVLALAALLSGCAGYFNRGAILSDLDPAPMTQAAWARAVGSYTGPIRSTTLNGGSEGLNVREVRLDISGTPYDPRVWFKEESDTSTAFSNFNEHKAIFTNIPEQRYGSQGFIHASTHAPNQLLLKMHHNGASPSGIWLIVTFRSPEIISVELIGHAGWRGEGDLWRAPVYARH